MNWLYLAEVAVSVLIMAVIGLMAGRAATLHRRGDKR